MSEWLKNTGVKPDVEDKHYEVKLADDTIIHSFDEWQCGGFDWEITENV